MTLVAANDSSTLRFEGLVSIKATKLSVRCSDVVLAGRCWLEADEYDQLEFLKIEAVAGRSPQLGLGGVLSKQYPWSAQPTSISESPFDTGEITDPARKFVRTMAERLPSAVPIVVTERLDLAEDDRVAFLQRHYGAQLPEVLRLMFRAELATSEPMSARGAAKLRIRFTHSWWTLDEMIVSQDPSLGTFAEDLRELLS